MNLLIGSSYREIKHAVLNLFLYCTMHTCIVLQDWFIHTPSAAYLDSTTVVKSQKLPNSTASIIFMRSGHALSVSARACHSTESNLRYPPFKLEKQERGDMIIQIIIM